MTPVRHKIRALVGEAAIREHSHGHDWEIHADEKGLECATLGACIPESEAIFRRTKWPEKLRRRM